MFSEYSINGRAPAPVFRRRPRSAPARFPHPHPATEFLLQLDRFPVVARHQFIMLESLRWLVRCRLDRFLRRRLAGFNPTSEGFAKHADRTELRRSRKLVATARTGALGLRHHGSNRPSAATRADGNTTLQRMVRKRATRFLANCCPCSTSKRLFWYSNV
jgi:hypothetical protein